MSFQSDMQALLADQVALGEGETITYCPYQAAPRQITALVDRREPLAEFGGGGSVPVLRYQLMVSRDELLGVWNPTEGKDVFELKARRDDLQASPFRLARVVQADTGAYVLEVVK
ncbi:MAG: hypothetical protein OEQ18_00725 [Gammaproteobacteria bacterium]|nr:hypothetical protein [Gammaproteobacteria bacterium]